MDEQQLLKAIGQMMDEKLSNMVTKKDLDEKLSGIKDNFDEKVRKLHILIEDNHNDIRSLLREDYTPIRKKVAEFSDYPQIKSQVTDHDRALQTQRKEIDELKKKAI